MTIPAKLFRRGKEMKFAIAPEHGDAKSERDPALIRFVVRAHMARAALEQSSGMTIEGLASQQSYTRDYYVLLLRIAYLAPDITAAILDGRQRLAGAAALPMDWQSQRECLGFTRVDSCKFAQHSVETPTNLHHICLPAFDGCQTSGVTGALLLLRNLLPAR